jgi:hypothetical protein
MNREPLAFRLYFQPAYYELARAVSYGGVRTPDLKPALEELSKQHGAGDVRRAFYELLVEEEQTGLTVLRQHVRRLCSQLLGPPPESPDYESYWEGRQKPAHHQPPKLVISKGKPEPEPPKQPQPPDNEPSREEEKPTMAEAGISVEGYARMAREKNKRALLCMLRDARKRLKHNGRRCFSGKEARKEIAAAEAELKRRGMDVPPDEPPKKAS